MSHLFFKDEQNQLKGPFTVRQAQQEYGLSWFMGSLPYCWMRVGERPNEHTEFHTGESLLAPFEAMRAEASDRQQRVTESMAKLNKARNKLTLLRFLTDLHSQSIGFSLSMDLGGMSLLGIRRQEGDFMQNLENRVQEIDEHQRVGNAVANFVLDAFAEYATGDFASWDRERTKKIDSMLNESSSAAAKVARNIACQQILVEKMKEKEFFRCVLCDSVLYNYKQALVHFTSNNHCDKETAAVKNSGVVEFRRILDAFTKLPAVLAEKEKKNEQERRKKSDGSDAAAAKDEGKTAQKKSGGAAAAATKPVASAAKKPENSEYDELANRWAVFYLDVLEAYKTGKREKVLRSSDEILKSPSIQAIYTSEPAYLKCREVLLNKLKELDYVYCAECDSVLHDLIHLLIHMNSPNHRVPDGVTPENFHLLGDCWKQIGVGILAVMIAIFEREFQVCTDSDAATIMEGDSKYSNLDPFASHLLPSIKYVDSIMKTVMPLGVTKGSGELTRAELVDKMMIRLKENNLCERLMKELHEHIGDGQTRCLSCKKVTGTREEYYMHLSTYSHIEETDGLDPITLFANMCLKNETAHQRFDAARMESDANVRIFFKDKQNNLKGPFTERQIQEWYRQAGLDSSFPFFFMKGDETLRDDLESLTLDSLRSLNDVGRPVESIGTESNGENLEKQLARVEKELAMKCDEVRNLKKRLEEMEKRLKKTVAPESTSIVAAPAANAAAAAAKPVASAAKKTEQPKSTEYTELANRWAAFYLAVIEVYAKGQTYTVAGKRTDELFVEMVAACHSVQALRECREVLLPKLKELDYFYCSECDMVLHDYKHMFMHVDSPDHYVKGTQRVSAWNEMQRKINRIMMYLVREDIRDWTSSETNFDDCLLLKYVNINPLVPHPCPDAAFIAYANQTVGKLVMAADAIECFSHMGMDVVGSFLVRTPAELAGMMIVQLKKGDLVQRLMNELHEHIGDGLTRCAPCNKVTGTREEYYRHLRTYSHIKKADGLDTITLVANMFVKTKE